MIPYCLASNKFVAKAMSRGGNSGVVKDRLQGKACHVL